MTKLDLFTIKGRGWSTPAFLSYPYIVKYIGARAGGGGGGLQPPQIWGNSVFLGSKRKFGQSQFLKTSPWLFDYFEDLNINLIEVGVIIQLHSHETMVT